jgi:hypothetical protein
VYEPEPVYHSEPSVYYEDEDPYVDHHVSSHHTVYDHHTHETYTDSVYESSVYSSAGTSAYGETSYRSPRRVHQPVRNYEHVEPYRPETTYRPPAQQKRNTHHDLPEQVQIHYDADKTSYVGDDGDVVINIFNGVGVPNFGR